MTPSAYPTYVGWLRMVLNGKRLYTSDDASGLSDLHVGSCLTVNASKRRMTPPAYPTYAGYLLRVMINGKRLYTSDDASGLSDLRGYLPRMVLNGKRF